MANQVGKKVFHCWQSWCTGFRISVMHLRYIISKLYKMQSVSTVFNFCRLFVSIIAILKTNGILSFHLVYFSCIIYFYKPSLWTNHVIKLTTIHHPRLMMFACKLHFFFWWLLSLMVIFLVCFPKRQKHLKYKKGMKDVLCNFLWPIFIVLPKSHSSRKVYQGLTSHVHTSPYKEGRVNWYPVRHLFPYSLHLLC